MRKFLVGSLMVGAIGVGSMVVAVVDPVGAVSAAVSGKTDHAAPLTQALDELVGEGTISQDQANAVTDRVETKRDEAWARRPHLGKQLFTGIAQQLNMDPKDLLAELRSGKSIADVAREKSVDPQSIIDSLVGTISGGIDQRVEKNKMGQERADAMKAHLSERVTEFVNQTHDAHPGKPHQGQQDAPAAPPATDTTPPATDAPTTTAPDTTTSTAADSTTTTAAGGDTTPPGTQPN